MERYVDSWSYAVKGTPIENLMFDISVYRAPITADGEKKLIAQRRFIPWAQKVFSPNELVQMYNGVHSAAGAGSTAEDQLRRLLEPFPGATAEEKMKQYLEKNAREEEAAKKRAEQEQLQQQQRNAASSSNNNNDGDDDGDAAAANSNSQDQNSEPPQQMQQKMMLSPTGELVPQQTFKGPPVNYHVFTRPPAETFLHPTDRFSEVIPPQPMTNLAASVLRLSAEQREVVDAAAEGHKSALTPEQYMQSVNLLVPSVKGTAVGPTAKHVPTSVSERSMFFLLASGLPSQPVDGNASGLPPRFQWRGIEEVLIQLVRMSDGTLITRPSLGEEHTVHVDDTNVVSVVVSLSQAQEGALAVVDAADKHQLARKSVLVDPEEEEVLTPTGGAGNKNRKDQGEVVDEASERRWRSVKADVVKRGVVMEMAKRAQSPSAPDASGKVGSVRMLRQALGVHDPPPSQRKAGESSSAAFKTGAEVFAPKRPKDILNILDDNNANSQQNREGDSSSSSNKKQQQQQQQPAFTPLPPPGTKRVHWFLTLDSVLDIERESLFARCTWILPPAGVVLDSDTDRKAGVREVMQLTTQTAFAGRYLSSDFMYTTKHVLNTPLELHCLVHDVTPGAPRLVIEIFSGGDGLAPQQLEGYGLVTCSPTPGVRQLRVDLWRPAMSGWEALKSIFVGGSSSLVERESVALPYAQLAADAHNLDATVRRELAESMAMEQQQQALAGVVGDDSQMQQQQQELQQRLQGKMVAPLEKLPPEVERDVALASSVAAVNRSGLMTTSEGCIDLQVMCFVQQA